MVSRWFRQRQQPTLPSPIDVLGLPYLRVSTGKQERGYSPEAQRKEIAAYIRRQGWEPGPEYRDTNKGTKVARADYQRLLADARKLATEGRAVAIVSVALDRFGRNLEEQLRSKRELTGQGAVLHFTREGGELDDDGTIMRGWWAQKEVKKTSERVIGSKRIAADHGLPPSGPAAWGYRWRLPQTPEEERLSIGRAVRRILDINDAEAPYLQELFRRAAEGESIRCLGFWARDLTEEARGGRHLANMPIYHILRNPLYIGRYDRGESGDGGVGAVLALPKGRWPALVEDATWAAVQRRINSHAQVPRQASKKYLLTGMIFCSNPECGSRMIGSAASAKPPRLQARYRCNSGLMGAGRKRCAFAAMMPQVDEQVLSQVGAVLDATTDPLLIADIRSAWDELHAPATPAADRGKRLDAEIAKLRNRIIKAREDLYDEEIDQAEHDAIVSRARAALDERVKERASLRDEPTGPSRSLDDVLAEAKDWSSRLKGAPVAAQRDVLTELIERVEPVRIGYGKYRTDIIKWTDTGGTLREIAAAVSAQEPPQARRGAASRLRVAK